jgi:DNA-binding NarL/FixJ family response regulator
MNKMVSDHSCVEKPIDAIVAALGAGIIVLDSDRNVVWMDQRTTSQLNGGLEHFKEALRTLDPGAATHCLITTQEVVINDKPATLCLIQEQEAGRGEQEYDAIAAVEAAMADTSWFTRTVIEKLKAFRQAKQPAPRKSELDALSDREREVLGLICEGRSDAQMGAALTLSQNTIRNHIASLYRKIGVNRRSGAIIWARERGITSQDARALEPRSRQRHRGQ